MSAVRVAITPGDFDGHPHFLARPAADTGGGPAVQLGPLAPLDLADLALFPFEVSSCVSTGDDRSRLLEVVAANAVAGLRTLLVVSHDHSRPLSLGQPDSMILRTSMVASERYSSEYAMPVVVPDPLDGADIDARPWRDRPTVGFMGQVSLPGLHAVLREPTAANAASAGFEAVSPGAHPVLPSPVDIGGLLRRRALRSIAASTVVRPDIVVRDGYFGAQDAHQRARMRREYLDHLLASDYVLCVRGAGNFSIRLFETLAVGRIPVILDTELVLPCADEIDWRELGVWVPLPDLDAIDERVIEAHVEWGPDGFEERQRAARSAYLDLLSAAGFARYVVGVIRVELAGRDGSRVRT